MNKMGLGLDLIPYQSLCALTSLNLSFLIGEMDDYEESRLCSYVIITQYVFNICLKPTSLMPYLLPSGQSRACPSALLQFTECSRAVVRGPWSWLCTRGPAVHSACQLCIQCVTLAAWHQHSRSICSLEISKPSNEGFPHLESQLLNTNQHTTGSSTFC